MTGRPLTETPALNNLLGRLKLEVLARNVTTKELELASNRSTLEDLGRGSCESSDSSRVDKGLVQLLGSGTELFVIGDGSGVYDAASLGLGAGGGSGLGSSTLVNLGSGKSTGWVGAWGMLDILAMLRNQGGSKLLELLSQLGDEFRTDKILNGLLLLRLRENIYVKLRGP